MMLEFESTIEATRFLSELSLLEMLYSSSRRSSSPPCNRNTSVAKKDFGMDHFNRKLEAKEHWRQGTEMGKYADKLARNKASLRDVF